MIGTRSITGDQGSKFSASAWTNLIDILTGSYGTIKHGSAGAVWSVRPGLIELDYTATAPASSIDIPAKVGTARTTGGMLFVSGQSPISIPAGESVSVSVNISTGDRVYARVTFGGAR